MDEGRRELLAAPTVSDRAVARFEIERSLELGLVPSFGVADIGQTEVVLLGPEERYGIETLAPPEDVARRGLPLALGHHPVLDADALAGERIRPARDVAGGEDAGDAGFEVLVDRDATIGGEAD